jgi:hypothetical protein
MLTQSNPYILVILHIGLSIRGPKKNATLSYFICKPKTPYCLRTLQTNANIPIPAK